MCASHHALRPQINLFNNNLLGSDLYSALIKCIEMKQTADCGYFLSSGCCYKEKNNKKIKIHSHSVYLYQQRPQIRFHNHTTLKNPGRHNLRVNEMHDIVALQFLKVYNTILKLNFMQAVTHLK